MYCKFCNVKRCSGCRFDNKSKFCKLKLFHEYVSLSSESISRIFVDFDTLWTRAQLYENIRFLKVFIILITLKFDSSRNQHICLLLVSVYMILKKTALRLSHIVGEKYTSLDRSNFLLVGLSMNQSASLSLYQSDSL